MGIVIARTVIVYVALLVIMRVLGKRQLGEMELSEFVVAALIADLAAHPLQDIGIPMINGLVPIIVLFCGEVFISGISLKNIRVRRILFGTPSILIHEGKIDQVQMRKNRFTIDELTQELRSQGITDISKIEYAILETDGQLNIIMYASEMPVTPAQLGINAPSHGFPVIVIEDGRVLTQNLHALGLEEKWLDKQIKAHGAGSARDVFLMTVNASREIYFARKEG